jgi:hypothetical protein
MHDFLLGAMATLCWVSTLFFVRFWRITGDRLFALFAAAFFLLGLTRLGLSITNEPSEVETYLYWVRLVAFLIILAAIVDKNRR